MAAHWEKTLARWTQAGLIDQATAERIRLHEEAESAERAGLSRQAIIALILGGIALAAGILLFVAAHWEQISPSARFILVLFLVGVFHGAGAFTGSRYEALATTFHGLGTAALGAAIFLAAQIFNLQEHWPGGLMLWSLGAWIAWALRRDPVQAVLVALLTPAWLASEWSVATEKWNGPGQEILMPFVLLLAIVYMSAPAKDDATISRRALGILGTGLVIPCALADIFVWGEEWWRTPSLPTGLTIVGWSGALILPLAVAFALRRQAAWPNLLAAIWAPMLGYLSARFLRTANNADVAVYLWCALGFWLIGRWGTAEGRTERVRMATVGFCGAFLLYAFRLSGIFESKTPAYFWIVPAAGWVACVAWGVTEHQTERINLGVGGFALSVVLFYFSSVMDKLGRSLSLMALGALFLAGGWALERLRRKLVRQVREARP